MSRLILAVPDLGDEAALVAAARPQRLDVVRRCVDAADLLAAAAADSTLAVAVSADTPRLTGDLVARLLAGGRCVVGIAATSEAAQRLNAWGVDAVILHAGDAESTMRAVALRMDRPAGGVWSLDTESTSSVSGLVVAVWGPTGAPGRTTTAIALSEAFARRGLRTCLVDADLQAPGVVPQLGVLRETSGLVVACRHADNGTLTERSLLQCSRELAPNLSMLGGLMHVDQRSDIRESASREVWECAKRTFDVVVVDIGCAIGDDSVGNGGSTLLATRREVAASTVLAVADRVLVVARASMLGCVRLLNELPALAQAPAAVALTGDESPGEVERVLRACGVVAPVIGVHRAPRELERIVRDGALPGQRASRRARRQLSALVDALLAEPGAIRGRAGRRRGRRP